MIEIQAPADYQQFSQVKIFLGGSIEMGKAEDWQQEMVNALKDLDIVILNPRRADWNSSWEQSTADPQFLEQVMWELSALEDADVIIIYFDPATKAPISLLELGLHARHKGVMVCCPEGFYRKGNVDITCQRYGVPVFLDLAALVRVLRSTITTAQATQLEAQPKVSLSADPIATFDDTDVPDLDDIQPPQTV